MSSIRSLDICFALLGLVLLFPLVVIVALSIKVSSIGPIFFSQIRVGKNNIDFKLLKFRTMYVNAESKGQLTIGGNDSRITYVGFFLRKFKIDELPQLINVLLGNMSFVGPRPEVRKYVQLYTKKQQEVLLVLPGITDFASIQFRNENELLAKATNPEHYYINVIMPQKIELNRKFIENRNIFNYFKILFTTFYISLKGS